MQLFGEAMSRMC